MPDIEVNGTRLHYDDTGPGSTGETIAFSHGLLFTSEMFEAQVAALRGRYRCIAWDHRGQGRSASDDRHVIGIELVWKDAVQLLEALGAGPVHFCGLSMGGFVALRMAARRPDLVRSLILIETSADPEPNASAAKYRSFVAVARVLPLRVLASRVVPLMFGRTFLEDPSRRAERERYVDLMASRKDIWKAVGGVVERAGMDDELRRIGVPTLVLVGEEDEAIEPARGERMARAIAGAELVRIPRAGHSSTIEQPAAVTAAIEAFLTGRDAR